MPRAAIDRRSRGSDCAGIAKACSTCSRSSVSSGAVLQKGSGASPAAVPSARHVLQSPCPCRGPRRAGGLVAVP
eukprot:15472151-Alexandrium_andersonii.AAC.1